MAKPDLKAKALLLRKEGRSYSQIKQKIRVSKSTLSNWLHHLPLSKSQLEKLQYRSEIRIEKFRQTMAEKKERKQRRAYSLERKRLLPLTSKELYLAGLFLYWGEGGKTCPAMVNISNTDPKVMQFILYWMEKCLRVKRKNISAIMHLYSDMDEEKVISFWMKKLGLKRHQFKKSYVKKTKLSGLTYPGFGNGTCNLQIGNVSIKRKVMMGIKAIADYYAEKLI